MVKHNNASIAIDAARILATKGDFLSDEVDGPVAVIPIERFCNIQRELQRSVTGNNNVYTTPTDKDFYLTGFVFSYMCDATADNTNITAFITTDGVTKNIARAAKITTTATSGIVAVEFNKPIKIDRGTIIGSSSTFTVGNCTHSLAIRGYTVETTN